MKTVLISGSTSGIGLEFSVLFAQQGYSLVLVSRNKAKLEVQKQELEECYDVNVATYAFDLSVPGIAKKLYNCIREPIDILINNAGFMEYGNVYENNLEKEVEMIQLHTIFLSELTSFYIRDMIQQKHGKILNVASTAAFAGLPYGAVYGATKAYVLSYSKALHAEVKKYGISVSALCPGATKTQFAKKSDIESTALFTNFVMDANKVAKVGYYGLLNNKRVIVPGIQNKILYVFSRIIPIFIIEKVLKKIMKKS